MQVFAHLFLSLRLFCLLLQKMRAIDAAHHDKF